MTGTLPASLSSLSNLLYLNIKDNQYLGDRKPLPVQTLLNLPKLNRLPFVNCRFLISGAPIQGLQGHFPR